MKKADKKYRAALLALDRRVERLRRIEGMPSAYTDEDRERIRAEYADHCTSFKDWELLAQRLPVRHSLLIRVRAALTKLAQTENQQERLAAFLDGTFAQGKLAVE